MPAWPPPPESISSCALSLMVLGGLADAFHVRPSRGENDFALADVPGNDEPPDAADHRERHRNLQAGEDRRHRMRQVDSAEHGKAAALHGAGKIDHIRVDRL